MAIGVVIADQRALRDEVGEVGHVLSADDVAVVGVLQSDDDDVLYLGDGGSGAAGAIPCVAGVAGPTGRQSESAAKGE